MKITYRGGYNKRDPKQEMCFVLPSHSEFVQNSLRAGKRIAVITYAKPDGYYDSKIKKHFGDKVDIIATTTENPDWNSYDIVYLLGGSQHKLLELLQKNRFTLDKLKKETHLIGDSAGAIVLSAFFYWIEADGQITFHEGLNPESNLIVIVHADNKSYSPKHLIDDVRTFAKQHGLEMLIVNENQEITK